jgi:peptide chain release factor 1
VPDTEKRGRVHTSSITVAVLDEAEAAQIVLHEKDLEYKYCRSSGPGGQNVNKTDSAVILTHLPTKTSVRCESERSQLQNKANALEALKRKLLMAKTDDLARTRAKDRKDQVGGGMRGDKRRTVALQRGDVVDDITGKRVAADAYLKGDLAKLW